MTKETTQRFRAFAAGFVDADGSIGVYWIRSNRYRAGGFWKITVGASQRAPAVLRQLRDFFQEGQIRQCGENDYKWEVQARDAVEEVLLQLLPYLLVKRRQALYAILACRLLRKGELGKLERVAYHVKNLKRNSYHPSLETFGRL